MYSNEIGLRQPTMTSIATDSLNLKAQAGSVAGKDTAAVSSAASASDQMEISAAASQMASQANGLAGSSDVRMEKVVALQLAIQNGSYNVPAADVADKLIQSMAG